MGMLLITLIPLKLKTLKLYVSKSLSLDLLMLCLLLSLNLSNLDLGDSNELTLIMDHVRNGLVLLPFYSGCKRLAVFGHLHLNNIIVIKSRRAMRRTKRQQAAILANEVRIPVR